MLSPANATASSGGNPHCTRNPLPHHEPAKPHVSRTLRSGDQWSGQLRPIHDRSQGTWTGAAGTLIAPAAPVRKTLALHLQYLDALVALLRDVEHPVGRQVQAVRLHELA